MNRPLTKDEADELIQGKIEGLFLSPPIVLSGDTKVDQSTVVEPFDLGKATKPFTDFISGINSTTLLIIGVVIVVLFVGFILVVMAGVIIYLLLKRR